MSMSEAGQRQQQIPWGNRKDFNPKCRKAPTIPKNAKKYNISDWNASAMHIHLYSLYTYPLRQGNEWCVIGGDFLLFVRAQSDVRAYRKAVNRKLRADAMVMLNPLPCGRKDTFTDCGSSLVVADFLQTPNVRLSLQGFTVYWKAQCEIGPKKCNVKMKRCNDKCGSKAYFSCDISWSMYDYYDFKSYIPFGWIGRPFHIVGYWNDMLGGTVISCKNK